MKKLVTGFVWHEIYMWHDTSGYCGLFESNDFIQPYRHYEAPEAKRRIRNLLEVSGMLDHLQPVSALEPTDEDLLRIHSPDYLNKVKALDGAHGVLDGETKVAKASVKIARKSVGGVMAAVKAVVQGDIDNAYVLTRPPGHHATPNQGLGFCIFANIAIAVEYARAVLGLQKIAVVDWDVHHGNGTESCFYDNPEVLTISLHQDNLFPQNSGDYKDIGTNAGLGKNINIPLPAGCGDGAYKYAFDQLVIPALNQFEPELIFVACGFDSSIEDPLGRMMLHAESYEYLTESLKQVANQHCSNKLIIVHEGGYNPMVTPYLGLSVVEALQDFKTGIKDPALEFHKQTAGQDLQPHQKDIIDHILEYHRQCSTSPLKG